MAEAFSVAPKSVEDWTWASVSKGKGPNRPVSTIRHLRGPHEDPPRIRRSGAKTRDVTSTHPSAVGAARSPRRTAEPVRSSPSPSSPPRIHRQTHAGAGSRVLEVIRRREVRSAGL